MHYRRKRNSSYKSMQSLRPENRAEDPQQGTGSESWLSMQMDQGRIGRDIKTMSTPGGCFLSEHSLHAQKLFVAKPRKA